jgi:hypothetical protein
MGEVVRPLDERMADVLSQAMRWSDDEDDVETDDE